MTSTWDQNQTALRVVADHITKGDEGRVRGKARPQSSFGTQFKDKGVEM